METASVPSGTDTWNIDTRKRVKPSQGQLGLIRGLILCLFFDIIGGTILITWNFVNSDASKRHSKMEHLSKKNKHPVNHKSRWLEEGFRYRWLVVKEIGAAFSVSITLVFNHLRWNLSFSLNSSIFILKLREWVIKMSNITVDSP